MNFSTSSIKNFGIYATTLLVTISLITGCAELDRLTKPRVEGLQQAHDFNSVVLTEGGISNTRVRSSLKGNAVNTEVLETMLDGAIRTKRPDVAVGSSGRYHVTANVIANDVSKRDDDLDNTIYKWTKRRVKVSYVVVDVSTGGQVWSGIIETYDESMATYEKKKEKKSIDKVLDAIATSISKKSHVFI